MYELYHVEYRKAIIQKIPIFIWKIVSKVLS